VENTVKASATVDAIAVVDVIVATTGGDVVVTIVVVVIIVVVVVVVGRTVSGTDISFDPYDP